MSVNTPMFAKYLFINTGGDQISRELKNELLTGQPICTWDRLCIAEVSNPRPSFQFKNHELIIYNILILREQIYFKNINHQITSVVLPLRHLILYYIRTCAAVYLQLVQLYRCEYDFGTNFRTTYFIRGSFITNDEVQTL